MRLKISLEPDFFQTNAGFEIFVRKFVVNSTHESTDFEMMSFEDLQISLFEPQ